MKNYNNNLKKNQHKNSQMKPKKKVLQVDQRHWMYFQTEIHPDNLQYKRLQHLKHLLWIILQQAKAV